MLIYFETQLTIALVGFSVCFNEYAQFKAPIITKLDSQC